jgi:para-aminobenzoate synthetase / 4-amino-4-deoxychorismate lyase
VKKPEIQALVDGVGPPGSSAGVWIFREPAALIEARNQCELEDACLAIDEASRSCHVVVLAEYEVGSWFEPKLKIAEKSNSWAPFQAWIFEEATWRPKRDFDQWLTQVLARDHAHDRPSGIGNLCPALSRPEYLNAVQSALEYIAAGEIYQLNFTWKLDFTYFGPPLGFYLKLRQAQPVNHGAFIGLPDRVILSLSPELFLERRGDRILARPMKGTRTKSDSKQTGAADALAKSEKDRAENLMIVDLIRNDLGKIAEIGSVQVGQLFRVEEYPTIYQMVSEVSARIPDRSFYRILEALFPCGSVTGAPKIRAMQIIDTLERSSRGLYTGTIGHIRPGGDFSFNVAIRTIELTSGNRGRLHIGSGIVADSLPASEYAECQTKARFLTELRPDFQLFETLLFVRGVFMRLEAHLERLRQSVRFFRFKYDESALRHALVQASRRTDKDRCRVKLMLSWDGEIDLQIHALSELPLELRFVVAAKRTESADPLLRHKTTARKLYDEALAELKTQPMVFDVLFFNEQGELTEGARTNIFLVKNGAWFTPPIESGLLNGIMRNEIVNTRRVYEEKLYHEDLINADAVYLSNSLRGLLRVTGRNNLV